MHRSQPLVLILAMVWAGTACTDSDDSDVQAPGAGGADQGSGGAGQSGGTSPGGVGAGESGGAAGAAGAGGSEPAVSYEVGEEGPAGGIVFFRDTEDEYDFEYLEAAPSHLELDNGTVFFTWAAGFGDAFFMGVTSTAIGAGRTNTQTIVAALEDDEQSGRAAQRADAYELNGYDDWFLPSEAELELMYETLHLEGLGNFEDGTYWSSTESNATHAMGQSFNSGTKTSWQKTFGHYVRPVRAF